MLNIRANPDPFYFENNIQELIKEMPAVTYSAVWTNQNH